MNRSMDHQPAGLLYRAKRVVIAALIPALPWAGPCPGQATPGVNPRIEEPAPAPVAAPAPASKPAPPPKPIEIGEKPAIPGLPELPPTTLSATQIAPFLDIQQVTSQQWAGAVSAAMEGTRLVYGPMTVEETESFERRWAPMFDHPFQEGVDWLNKLNPLLGQFLAIRATMADTAMQFDGAWKEAVTAAAIHDEQGVREALSLAYSERQMLVGLSKQFDEVVKEILELGDPPSAEHHRRKVRQEEDEAVKDTKKIIGQVVGAEKTEETPPVKEGRWVMTRSFAPPYVKRKNPAHEQDTAKVVEGPNSATVSFTTFVPPPPSDTRLNPKGDPGYDQSATWKVSWTTPPGILPMNNHLATTPWTFAAELTDPKGFYQHYGWDSYWDNGASCRMETIVRQSPPNHPNDDWDLNLETFRQYYWREREVETIFLGNPVGTTKLEEFKQTKTFTYRGATTQDLIGAKYYIGVLTEVDLNHNWVKLARIYQYEWDPTGDSLQPIMEGNVETTAEGPQIKKRTPEELAEEIGFYEDCIKIIRANMAKDQEELGRTSDAERRTELVNRIVVAQANIQAEEDRISTLKSGQIVHTRTAWDEMQSAAFIRNCQKEVNEMAARDRLRVGALRMAGRADPGQAERLRKFVLDHTDPAADSTKLRKIAHMVYNQVQGDLEAKAAASEEAAINAEQNLAYIESVKSTCDKGMFVGALMGGHSVMVAYEGAIGFIEGPPSDEGKAPTDPALGSRIFEGVKRAGMWYNTATFVATEALEGYEKGGYLGGKENKGFWGAAERAGEAFLLAKSFEYLAGKIFGVPPKPGELPRRPTVKESFELARYRQECEYAKALVEDYKRTFAEYRRIQQFNASAAEMAAMEAQLRQKAASMHASFESKLYLKQIHGQGSDVPMLEDYVFRIGQNHEATREAWLRKMEAMGYDDVRHWKTMEFRNSASAGSPGMDHDMGVWDKGEKFYKDRVRVSTHAMNEDAQKAWEKAYQETTGYSAKQSFENITTSIHVEAYKDLSWIGDANIKHVKVNEILPGWAGQAADVTAVKNYDMFKNLTRMQAIIESGRGMAKDIQTKLLPVLEAGAKKFPKSGLRINGGVDPATGKRVTGLIEHWSQIRDILKTAADNPVEADRKIRLLTGKSICEITPDLRDAMSGFGVAVSR